ncbi:hypothetical protein M0R45_025869 [Rubus argutus]|uniref:Uncharacterized protein n=1 Tax=Rubus argutus TaxID=59490 RepID=A0AAW1WVG6_RUBAR
MSFILPPAKFEVLTANTGRGLVHIKMLSQQKVLASEGPRQASSTQENVGIMEIIDYQSLLTLPRHVSFKGPNGKYLGTVVLNHLGLALQFLAFDYTSKGRPETWFEVSTDGHGRAQFLSRHTKTFWRFGGLTIGFCLI